MTGGHMILRTLDGRTATISKFAELARAWYQRHGEDGLGGWEPPTPVRVATPPYSHRCRIGSHRACSGWRLADRKGGTQTVVRCECPTCDHVEVGLG